jgi:hypothetical protein
LQSAVQAGAAVGAAEEAVVATTPGSPGQRRFAAESNIIRQSASVGGVGGCFSPRRSMEVGVRGHRQPVHPQHQQQDLAGSPHYSSGVPCGAAGGVMHGLDRADTNLLRDSLSRSQGTLTGVAAALDTAASDLDLQNAPSRQIMQQQLACYFQQQQQQQQLPWEWAKGLGNNYLIQQQLQGPGQGPRSSSSWQAGGLLGRGGCGSVAASYSSFPGGLMPPGPATELQAEVLKLKQEVRG